MAYIKIHTLQSIAEAQCDHITKSILHSGEKAFTRHGHGVIMIELVDGMQRACEIVIELGTDGFEFNRVEIVSYA